MLCATDTTCLQNPVLRETWKADTGVKWYWHTDACAYWALCQPCHAATWPEDFRVKNGASKPWSAIAWSRCRMPLVGEFYITRPPPELIRKSFVDAAATHGHRPHRSRSPRLVDATGLSTSPQTVESLLVAIFGTADLPTPLQRSCMKGIRDGPAPTHVDLGIPFRTLRYFPDGHRFRKALRGQATYRVACVRESSVGLPLLSAEEK